MNRAVRRHHRERIFAKRVDQNRKGASRYTDPEWILWNARLRINTGKLWCGCAACIGRKYSYGNSWTGLDLQRVKADRDMRDQLNDL